MKNKATNIIDEKGSLEPSPQSGQATEEPSDRRFHTRYNCRLPSVCRPVGRHQNGNDWKGWIENVSQEGLKLTLNRRFEPGTLLTIEVDVSKQELDQVFNIPNFFLAKVVRVVSQPWHDRKWILGCCLVAQ